MPYNYNLRTDPYEFSTVTSNTYWDWYIDHAFLLYPMGDVVGEFIGTFKEYPPRMKAGSRDPGTVLKVLQTPHNKQAYEPIPDGPLPPQAAADPPQLHLGRWRLLRVPVQ